MLDVCDGHKRIVLTLLAQCEGGGRGDGGSQIDGLVKAFRRLSSAWERVGWDRSTVHRADPRVKSMKGEVDEIDQAVSTIIQADEFEDAAVRVERQVRQLERGLQRLAVSGVGMDVGVGVDVDVDVGVGMGGRNAGRAGGVGGDEEKMGGGRGGGGEGGGASRDAGSDAGRAGGTWLLTPQGQAWLSSKPTSSGERASASASAIASTGLGLGVGVGAGANATTCSRSGSGAGPGAGGVGMGASTSRATARGFDNTEEDDGDDDEDNWDGEREGLRDQVDLLRDSIMDIQSAYGDVEGCRDIALMAEEMVAQAEALLRGGREGRGGARGGLGARTRSNTTDAAGGGGAGGDGEGRGGLRSEPGGSGLPAWGERQLRAEGGVLRDDGHDGNTK